MGRAKPPVLVFAGTLLFTWSAALLRTAPVLVGARMLVFGLALLTLSFFLPSSLEALSLLTSVTLEFPEIAFSSVTLELLLSDTETGSIIRSAILIILLLTNDFLFYPLLSLFHLNINFILPANCSLPSSFNFVTVASFSFSFSRLLFSS